MLTTLYEKTSSLRKVNEITGIPISTLWYKLSKTGILNKKTKITQTYGNELLIGTYVGLWAGDGSRYHNNGFITKIHLDRRNETLIIFCKEIINNLFKKEVKLYHDSNQGNQASLKIHSEFIYKFPEKYLVFSRLKSESVCLRNVQSSKFNEGFILGLALSDGYLKKKFILSTISKNLAAQLMDLLKKLKLTPKMYVHERKKYGWNDLFMVRLTNNESEILRIKLDEVITKLGFKHTFDDLKYKWPRRDLEK